jgi:acyl carrier protein
MSDLQSVMQTLEELLQDVFDDDSIRATEGLTASEIDGWDSLGNVRLFLSVEQEFGVRFSAGEMGGFANVGELAKAILSKKK